ncbi:NAD/FAD-binding protein [Endozoicomonas sp. OPT23]|uniref:NAD(P)/FAD-dependent oxidoreductase n=1 Tax=Endozoicomonas sp. OPT23 TaxID=2072845 RepID=UPI00129ABDC7|nr:FAD-dependent oxidoreductase [Endozoicomonas sp. OPT23]MRI31849.1 NAD/FAD-binding protein [Endozoicomonas sp. OPT23]
MEQDNKDTPLNIAVIGSGISGLSCAWLLSHKHKVTLYEKDDRLGGHSHTVRVNLDGKTVDVDTGFIVFNENTYPNLKAFFRNLGVDEVATDMSFGVSLNQGALEYSGSDLNGIFAQRKNLLKPSYWRMLRDILRFYKKSEEWLKTLTPEISLGQLLKKEGFSKTFIRDHLLPMGAAIWSTPEDKMLDYPALAYLRFCQNHGLLQVSDRPRWLTVMGGSRNYVNKLADLLGNSVQLNRCVKDVKRYDDHVLVEDLQGDVQSFDHVVMASHADTSLSLLAEPDELEQHLLGSFSFQRNRAVLHSDESLMPENKRAWASWNYLGSESGQGPSVTYWMNRLQHIDSRSLFVTLNPGQEPAAEKIHGCYLYDHPVFDQAAMSAQKRLWELQGRNRTWFCGAWFGYGFHEDGIQSGLAVAEALGNVRRPWTVAGESDRLIIPDTDKTAGSIQG